MDEICNFEARVDHFGNAHSDMHQSVNRFEFEHMLDQLCNATAIMF